MSTLFVDDYLAILVENNTMFTYPPWPLEDVLHDCLGCDLAYPPDQIIAFLELYPYVTPTYIDVPTGEYGRKDPEYGNWSGMIGHVSC